MNCYQFRDLRSTTKIRYAYVNRTPNRSKNNFSRINETLRSLEKIGVEILLRLTSLLLVKSIGKIPYCSEKHKQKFVKKLRQQLRTTNVPSSVEQRQPVRSQDS